MCYGILTFCGTHTRRSFNVLYIKTCPWLKLYKIETCHQRKTFTVPTMWGPEGPNFTYLYETKPAYNGEKNRPIAVPLYAGFDVFIFCCFLGYFAV